MIPAERNKRNNISEGGFFAANYKGTIAGWELFALYFLPLLRNLSRGKGNAGKN